MWHSDFIGFSFFSQFFFSFEERFLEPKRFSRVAYQLFRDRFIGSFLRVPYSLYNLLLLLLSLSLLLAVVVVVVVVVVVGADRGIRSVAIGNGQKPL